MRGLEQALGELAKVTNRRRYEVVKVTCRHADRDKVDDLIQAAGYRREHGWMMADGTYCISAKREIKAAEIATGMGTPGAETGTDGAEGTG